MSNYNYANYGIALKHQILDEISSARIAHSKWVRKAQHLVANLPVNKEMIPVDFTECTFGKWLYEYGPKYKKNFHLCDIINEIEYQHAELHDTYLKIYKIYFLDTKRSWIMNVLTLSQKEISNAEQKKAKIYLSELEKTSKTLLKMLDHFEKILAVQANETIAALI
ncbi:MAG: CZB domain-containing protein [Sulfuricurvum sp.]|nr:CZB domain-containing protein [Sulfuricurvum sp.]